MIDPVSALVAAALFGTGWLIGRVARLRRRPGPVKPICMCGHQYGTHDPETGACGQLDRKYLNGVERMIPCPCVRYTGPQPVEQYWVPPAADLTIVTAPRPVDGGPR